MKSTSKKTLDHFNNIIDIIDEELSALRKSNSQALPTTFENILWFTGIIFSGFFLISVLLLLANPATSKIVLPIFILSFIPALLVLSIYGLLKFKAELSISKKKGLGKHFTKNRAILDREMLESTKKSLETKTPHLEREKFIIAMDYRISHETIFANLFISLLPLFSTGFFLITAFSETENITLKSMNYFKSLNISFINIYSSLILLSAMMFTLGVFIKFYLSPKWCRYKSCVEYSLT